MVVDDNPEILLLMKMLLEQIHGDAVDCFNSPDEALKAFTAAPEAYEVVITDFEMPGIDGIELCRRLRAMARSVKIFLATGSGFFTEAAAAHAGFLGLLNKPFRPEKLQALLAEAGVHTAPAVAT
jgi:CheY-like chemotaxis protein